MFTPQFIYEPSKHIYTMPDAKNQSRALVYFFGKNLTANWKSFGFPNSKLCAHHTTKYLKTIAETIKEQEDFVGTETEWRALVNEYILDTQH